MSTYDSGRSRTIAAATQAICVQLDIDEAALADLPALAAALTPLLESRDPQLIRNSVAQMPAVTRAALKKLAPAELRAVDTALRSDRPRLAATKALAAIDKAAVQLAGARRKVTVDAVTSFATDPAADFDKVRIARGTSVTAIDLRKESSRLMVRVHDDGRVEREYEGLVQNSCLDVDRAFVEHLRERGILLESQERDEHGGRRDGARLIAHAEARDAELPARGAVREAGAAAETSRARSGRELRRVLEEVTSTRERGLA